MNARWKRVFWSFLGLALAGAPAIASAQTFNNPLNPKGGPLSLVDIIARVVRGLLGVSASLAAVFIIIGGFRIIFAAGNEEMVSRGKNTLLWAIIGLVISFGGFVIMSALIARLPLLIGQPI